MNTSGFDDHNINRTLTGIAQLQIESELENLELPKNADLATGVLNKLTTAGCDHAFVLRTTWFYAMIQYGLEENRKATASIHPDYRKIQFKGRRFTRAHVKRHVRACTHLA